MGTVRQGKEGVIDNAVIKAKCDPPPKTYAKGLDLKVKLGLDSVINNDKNIDFNLVQTVTRLSDYSTDGLDNALVLFYICQISNNRGFTSQQTSHLIEIASEAWKKKVQ